MVDAVPKPARYADLLDLDEDVRAEILGGEIGLATWPRRASCSNKRCRRT
jgi:hypothetical protein